MSVSWVIVVVVCMQDDRFESGAWRFYRWIRKKGTIKKKPDVAFYSKRILGKYEGR